ncbi:hypothetical protein TVAG_273830 [Trichomonas vaginalis G3]|uniref:Uncharacterized protein n=1 Tax=Trichomonas vaginalis (strain ATCC PRA-98 / G3) TaxID=412133 RepID=A2EI60_TRIV3|nr:hypothetical protein TVAGG3_0521330 [Trichomonas vaginalis G3]EAY07699.1 hypothetical protein TVAG_273830 [Trichomonas vaginalis G3]KAI5518471.1 hypothetical protein TVAGG3_0521330 [Trichomonas vaginalis G3]|eukprot:XP_001319922.1 hypothetical protein [Trichomonas vaginalis G3]
MRKYFDEGNEHDFLCHELKNIEKYLASVSSILSQLSELQIPTFKDNNEVPGFPGDVHMRFNEITDLTQTYTHQFENLPVLVQKLSDDIEKSCDNRINLSRNYETMLHIMSGQIETQRIHLNKDNNTLKGAITANNTMTKIANGLLESKSKEKANTQHLEKELVIYQKSMQSYNAYRYKFECFEKVIEETILSFCDEEINSFRTIKSDISSTISNLLNEFVSSATKLRDNGLPASINTNYETDFRNYCHANQIGFRNFRSPTFKRIAMKAPQKRFVTPSLSYAIHFFPDCIASVADECESTDHEVSYQRDQILVVVGSLESEYALVTDKDYLNMKYVPSIYLKKIEQGVCYSMDKGAFALIDSREGENFKLRLLDGEIYNTTKDHIYILSF